MSTRCDNCEEELPEFPWVTQAHEFCSNKCKADHTKMLDDSHPCKYCHGRGEDWNIPTFPGQTVTETGLQKCLWCDGSGLDTLERKRRRLIESETS